MEIMSGETFSIVTAVMNIMTALFVLLVGLGVLTVIVLFIIDVTQTKSAIRRNYPVVGRFRYFFEHIGEFFRQYFFAMDREEMPFNRAQRSWAYRAAKDIDNTVGFGSTRDLRPTGTVMFVNCPFPTLGEDAVPPCDGFQAFWRWPTMTATGALGKRRQQSSAMLGNGFV